jgi:hypothetical protein
LEQRFESVELELSGFQLRVSRCDLRFGGLHLCLRLTDVLLAGARPKQPELSLGYGAVRSCTLNLQLRVSRVEACDHILRRDAIAFRHQHFQDAPGDLGRHLHLRGFHMTGHA